MSSQQPKTFSQWLTREGEVELTPHEQQEETNYFSTMTRLFNTVKDFIIRGIKDALAFLGDVLSKITPFLINLSSSVINMVISLYQLVGTQTSSFQKSLIAINLTGAFTAFITNVGTALKECNLPWSFQCAKHIVETIVNDIISFFVTTTTGTNANSLDSGAWVKIGIATISTVLIAGLGFTKTMSWKDLLTGTSLVGRMRDATRTVQDTASYILEEICGFSTDADYAVCKELEELISEGSRLQSLSAAHFIQHPDDHNLLMAFTKKIVKVTSQPISREAGNRYHTTRQLLVQMYKVLYDKLTTVNVILEAKQRQATVCVTLSGEPGVGKSELCKYLSKEVGKILKYRPAMYTLNKKSDGFFEPYGGQSFGIYNEWMATMSEDPILKDMNLIFSTDPMNFEGAALDCKNQPCKLKLGFLTANVDNPDFSRVLNSGACRAVWDRIYHIRVRDPLCEGRDQPNAHRKPDFSHLEFDYIKHPDAANIKEMGSITMRTLINRLVGKCAIAEISYIRSVLEDDNLTEETRHQLRCRISELQALTVIHSPYDDRCVSNMDSEDDSNWGRDFFCVRFQGLSGSGKSTLAKSVAADLSSLLNYRFQRSRCLMEFKPDIEHPMIYFLDDWVERPCDQDIALQKMNATHEKSIFLIASNTVYKRIPKAWSFANLFEKAYAYWEGLSVLDPIDCTMFRGPEGLLRRMGLQGTVIAPGGDPIIIDEQFSRTYNFGAKYTIRDNYGALQTRDMVMNDIFNGYRVFLGKPGNLLMRECVPPVIKEASVRIIAKKYSDVIAVLKSTTQMMKAYLGQHQSVQFVISSDLLHSGSQVTLDMWNVPEDTTESESSVRDIFSRMCAIYAKTAPGHSLEIRITDMNKVFYYYDYVGYIYNDNEAQEVCPIEAYDDFLIYHRTSTDMRRITINEYHAFKNFRQFVGSYRDLTLGEILQIDRWVASEISNPLSTSKFKVEYVKAMNKANRENTAAYKTLTTQYKTHPVFWVACSLLTMITSGLLITKLVGLVTSKPEQEVAESNSFDNDRHRITNKISVKKANSWDDSRDKVSGKLVVRRANTFENDRNKVSGKLVVRRNAAEDYSNRNFKERLNQQMAKPTLPYVSDASRILVEQSSRLFPNGLTQEEIIQHAAEVDRYKNYELGSGFEDYVFSPIENREGKNNLEYVMSNARNNASPDSVIKTKFGQALHSNMLQQDDMIKQLQTPVEIFHAVANKYYYKLINDRGGACYAFGLIGKLLLTVAHMARKVGEPCTIQSGSVQFDARVVLIERSRDLAIVEVVDKTFPAIANTRAKFHERGALHSALYGYFLRCGPDCQLAGGYMSFHDTSLYPITDDKNPDFRLSDKLFVFSMIGCHKIRTFVKKGDCGFPLVAPNDAGVMKIIGIHNAYADMEKVYFSSFTQEDFDDMVRRALEFSSNMGRVKALMEVVELDGVEGTYLLPEPYVEAIQDCRETRRFPHHQDKLNLIGYSYQLSLPSRPKNKSLFLDLPGMMIPNLKLPAAVDMSRVKDASALATDARGIPDPLFTQCLKYDKRIGYGFDINILLEAAQRVSEDMMARYGKCKWLRQHEVLNGIGNDALSPFDPRTSAGPLLKMKYKIHNKIPVFRLADNKNLRVVLLNDSEAANMVKSHYDQYVDSLENGGPPPLLVSKDCAKVELLNAEKAEKGKVRLFNEVDLSINMVLKRYFGDFQNKVMARHEDNPIKMGQNPYKAATRIYKDFQRLDGAVVSTDFSGFDKQIPSVLILIFCRVAADLYDGNSHLLTEEIVALYDALAMTLTNALHTCHGEVYVVDRGNESGTFVTTLMNSVAVRTLTMYTVIRKWNELFKFTPTLAEMLGEYEEVIFGDDRALKTSKILPITQQELIEDSALFGLTCTPAKTSGYIDFCSRSFEWDEESQVCFPSLKVESIWTQIRWYKQMTREQIIDNIDNCLFEAALHIDPSVFDLALHDSTLVLEHFHIPRTQIQFLSRKLIRKRFIAYVYDLEEYAWLTHQVERETDKISDYFRGVETQEKRALNLRVSKDLLQSVGSTDNTVINGETVNSDLNKIRKYLTSVSTTIMVNPDNNPISAVLEALQACKIADKPVEEYSDLDGVFECVVTILNQKAKGTASSKQSAKRLAYRNIYDQLQGELAPRANAARPTVLQARIDADKYSKEYMYECIKVHLNVAGKLHKELRKPIVVLRKHETELGPVEGTDVRYRRDAEGVIYCISETAVRVGYDKLRSIYLAQPGTSEEGFKICVGADVTVSNMDATTVHTVGNLIQDSAANPGLSTIPHIQNVVPVTETAPATLPNDPPVMGAYEPLMPVYNLNPTGPPNMLSAGAIAFDLKDLAYNQFMDSNETIEYSTDKEAGSIIFSIPYDPLNKFMNPYAQKYVQLHERFAGDLEYRFTVISNQTFSGFLGLAWLPAKPPSLKMSLSELMKYNYVAESVSQPFSCRFTLSDARQTQFWRKTAEKSDWETRPHLVGFVIMNVQSPLMESPKVRIRIASRLCENFQVANPIITPVSPTDAQGLETNSYKRLLGQPVVPNIVRPYYPKTSNFRICIDGNTFTSSSSTSGSDYTISNWNWKDYMSFVSPTDACIVNGDQVALTSTGIFLYLDVSRAPAEFLKTDKTGNSFIYTTVADILADANGTTKNYQWVINQLSARTKTSYEMYFNRIAESDESIEVVGTNHATDNTFVFKHDVYDSCVLFYPEGCVFVFCANDTDSAKRMFPDSLKFVNFDPKQVRQILFTGTPADPMPPGWRHVAITPDLPYVSVEALVSSYIPNHISLRALIDTVNPDIGSTQLLQITISDYESSQPICFLRWVKERNCMVMNVGTQEMMYATSLRSCNFMFVSDVSIVERTNDFPITQLKGVFADNAIHPGLLYDKYHQGF